MAIKMFSIISKNEIILEKLKYVPGLYAESYNFVERD